MKTLRFPESLVLIFAMIVVAQLVGYIIPPGQYDREVNERGRAVVVPGSYKSMEARRNAALAQGVPASEAPQAPEIHASAFLTAIPRGMEKGADIIFFVFIVGGVIGVIRSTGAIDALIGAALKSFGSTPLPLVTGMMTLFAVGSSTIGMAEEYMPFVPILVTMCIALKMDAIVAMGIVYIGAGIGYGCAALNPFTVMIAQDIAGLEATSGQWLRWILLCVCIVLGVDHIMRYVRRTAADTAQSLVSDIDYGTGFDMPEDTQLTSRRLGILLVLVAGVALFVVGVARWHWYLTELAATFLGVALLTAAIGGLSPNLVARGFTKGAAELTTTALLIGFARAIQVVLDDSMVTDTVIHALAQPLKASGPEIASIGMLLVQSVCNFFIPSGSGQAYVTMPIMAPLAQVTNVPAQTCVLAYQFGDGFTNMIVPTNALLMGMLALGRIPYQRWLRFIAPLMVKLYLVAGAALVYGVWTGY